MLLPFAVELFILRGTFSFRTEYFGASEQAVSNVDVIRTIRSLLMCILTLFAQNGVITVVTFELATR